MGLRQVYAMAFMSLTVLGYLLLLDWWVYRDLYLVFVAIPIRAFGACSQLDAVA